MGLRDRLRDRQLPQAVVGIRLDWSERSYAAHNLVESLERRIAMASSEGDTELAAEFTAQLTEARAEVDGMYEYLTVHALPAPEMEALLSDHPPTEEDLKENARATFTPKTFFPALLAACIPDSETAEGWAEMLSGDGGLMMTEINALIGTAMQLNDRSPSVALGKGSTTTSS